MSSLFPEKTATMMAMMMRVQQPKSECAERLVARVHPDRPAPERSERQFGRFAHGFQIRNDLVRNASEMFVRQIESAVLKANPGKREKRSDEQSPQFTLNGAGRH